MLVHRAFLSRHISCTLSTLYPAFVHCTRYSIPTETCLCDHILCVMETVIDVVLPPELWSSCSVDSITTALTRPNNNLARCLHNTPEDPDATPVCGDCIIQGEEECDCGSPQVIFLLISNVHLLTEYDDICDEFCNNSRHAIGAELVSGLLI